MELSKRERQVLDLALTSADDTVVAMNLKIDKRQVATYKTRVRRKARNAEDFLKDLKQYKDVLYPKKKYKGI